MAGMGGHRENAGRKKGVPNKLTADLKAMILGALEDAGGRAYLARQAIETPGPFLTLIGKVLPLQVSGEGGGKIIVQVVTGVPTADDDTNEGSVGDE
jgi:hypothetical protein